MPKLEPLTGLDASFLYLEAAGTPMHVGSLMLLAKPPGRRDFHADLIAHLAGRLPQARALRRVLQEAPLDLGHPLWREVGQVDLAAHVLKRKLPGKGTPAQLDALVGKLHAQMLDRERPLWQFVVIEGLASGEIALYTKIHHAVLDGQGGVALAKVLLDLDPSPPRRRASASAAPARGASRKRASDGMAATVGANLRQLVQALRAVPPTLKLAAKPADGATWRQRLERLRESLLFAPRTPFNAQCSDERSFATASLSLEAAKRVAKANAASLNDVVLAVCASAIRGHLQRGGELPGKPLIAAMPVSLRSRDDAGINNQVSMVQCPLPTDLGDPHERLRAITSTTMGIKRSVGEFRHLIPTDYPGLGAPKWAPGLSRLWAKSRLAEKLPPLANVAISNVPGPPVPLYLAGAAVHHIFPVSIVTHGLGLNITVQTYAGMLEFGITACRQALPRPQALARALQPALDELLAPLDE